MKQDREMAYAVFFGDYEVAPPSVPDVIDHIENDVCPLCDEEREGLSEELPTAGDTLTFTCKGCGTEVSVEAWWVK